jgi:hypothetical protein
MRLYRVIANVRDRDLRVGDRKDSWFRHYGDARALAKKLTSGRCYRDDTAVLSSIDIEERPSFEMVVNALNGSGPNGSVRKEEIWAPACCPNPDNAPCTDECTDDFCAKALAVKEQPK